MRRNARRQPQHRCAAAHDRVTVTREHALGTVLVVPRDHDEPVLVAPDLVVDARRHLEALEALGVVALTQDEQRRKVNAELRRDVANLLVHVAKEGAAAGGVDDRDPFVSGTEVLP